MFYSFCNSRCNTAAGTRDLERYVQALNRARRAGQPKLTLIRESDGRLTLAAEALPVNAAALAQVDARLDARLRRKPDLGFSIGDNAPVSRVGRLSR